MIGTDSPETSFVNAFILPSKRERLMYELAKSAKRADCVWRFAH